MLKFIKRLFLHVSSPRADCSKWRCTDGESSINFSSKSWPQSGQEAPVWGSEAVSWFITDQLLWNTDRSEAQWKHSKRLVQSQNGFYTDGSQWKEQKSVMWCCLFKPVKSWAAVFWTSWRWDRDFWCKAEGESYRVRVWMSFSRSVGESTSFYFKMILKWMKQDWMTSLMWVEKVRSESNNSESSGCGFNVEWKGRPKGVLNYK